MPDTRWAVAAGAGALLLALVGYYGMVQLRFGYGGGTGSWIFWGLGALVGGPVFGVAGHWWRGPVHRRRAIAIGLLGAVADRRRGVQRPRRRPPDRRARRSSSSGCWCPLVFGRSRDDRLGGYVAMVPILLLGGTLGYLAFSWLASFTSGV